MTLSFLPTPLAEAVLEAGAVAVSGTPVRALLTGGDRLHRGPAAGSPFLLVNHYGPTECSVVSTVQRVMSGAGGAPPIGRPISSMRLSVVGRSGELVPASVAGELYAGGAGLARGYLGRPDLTAERFVPDPLAAVAGESIEPGARAYRTGDLVRWLADGSLEFLGRIDRQTKIRGFRIEPGEIEAVLTQHPEVVQSAVLVREDRPGDRRLTAYVVPRGAGGLSVADLRSHLKSRLPDFMLPAGFVLLPALPLTPNGKVDRRALPVPELGQREEGEERVASRTPAEELLVDLWADLLGVGQVGIHDNFFALGGHSLLATRVVSRVREVFGIELPLRALFDSPTVAGLAARLAAGTGETAPPPLLAAPREGELPLSFAQERLWFLDRLEPGGSAYNISAAVRLVGPLNVVAFVAALDEVVRRHEALRTGFREGQHEMAGRPVQVIEACRPIGLAVVDLSVLSGRALEAAILRLAGEEAGRPFDLAQGQPLRVALLRESGSLHVLLLTLHHIAADGWSMEVLVRELAALYGAFCAGRRSPLPELPIQYADFAVWQRAWLSGTVLEAQTAYWRQALAGAPTLDLPTDRPRPAVRSPRGAGRKMALSPGLSADLRRFARGQGATPFMALLAAFEILLGRLGGQEDLLVGSPIANRNHREIEGLIGFFVNTLVLRADLSGDPDFLTFLGRTREVTLAAYAHQDLPFDKLVLELAPVRDASRTPLFQVMFTLQNATPAVSSFAGLATEWLDVTGETAKFDLTLSLGSSEESGFVGAIEYGTDLFDASTVMRLAGHFAQLLKEFVAVPERRLGDASLLSATERQQAVLEWSGESREYPCEKSLPELFAEQAALAPDAVALVFAAEHLSYGALAGRAARLARHLGARGVAAGGRIGLCLERSLARVVATLAILEAGCAYLPLEPSYPRERLDFVLRDSAVPLILSEERLLSVLPESAAGVLCLDRLEEAAPPASTGLPWVPAGALAYVMYTSGSTGVPKSVAVPHRGVVRLVLGADYATFGADEVFLQMAPYAFDASTLEVWGALLSGGRLVIPPPGELGLEEIGTLLARHGITTLWLTAGLFHQMVDFALPALSGLRQLLAGGDILSPDHVVRAAAGLPRTRLINGYGPTENTTFTCCFPVGSGMDPSRPLPVGRPIANTRIYLLDRWQRPVPVGVTGELAVGGDGLAWGYLGHPDWTAERFVPSPFGAGEGGERLYRTGDLARWGGSGEVEFLGRIDRQTKIRGFRIEPGEIETVLAQHPEVVQSAVVVREDRPGDRRLTAYVVPRGAGGLSVADL
ncbi:MAG TPA: amino acid adenylation domain-containing protein, partial [Thermoanaerobaculia bacterium]|nr:amino acid adenylation domain-containing protein [Thermoanaerobaculia bacterium]